MVTLTEELNAIEKEGAALRPDPRREEQPRSPAQQKSLQAERETLAARAPGDLLALYDKLRAQLGGVGVGALQHGRCGGCQLNVGAADLARMADAPSDEVMRCEECNRILVRTHESGI